MTRFLLFFVCYLYTLPIQAKPAGSRTASGQHPLTLICTRGLSHYIGDLSGAQSLSLVNTAQLKQRTYFTGIGVSFSLRKGVNLQFSYTSGRLAASDQDAYSSQQFSAQQKRNLDFQSTIRESAASLLLYPFREFPCRMHVDKKKWQPYFQAGIGRYRFNPQGSVYDIVSADHVWVDLQPLHTEGQGMQEYPNRKPYSLKQWNFIYGAGIQYQVLPRVSLAMEWTGRKLFTDYLDDVSTTYINPHLFQKYLGPDEAVLAAQMSNKSILVTPNHPYQSGDKRGNSCQSDFYYSANLKLMLQLGSRKKPKAPLHYDFFKYDNLEICE